MVNPRTSVVYAATGLLITTLSGWQALGADETPKVDASVQQSTAETTPTTVEDGGTGPYKAILVGDSGLTTHTIFRPQDLSVFGGEKKLPIIAWGNSGCANSPSGCQNFLSEIASHGFLVIAIGPVQTGGGRGGGMMGMGGGTKSSQLLDAIDWAIAQNTNAASRYFNRIDMSKIGVSGHSCGGLQALEVSVDSRITTTIVCDSGILNSSGGAPGAGGPGMPGRGGAPGAGAPGMPGRGGGGGMMGMPPLTKDHLSKLHAPVLYLLGGPSDIAYPNGTDDFKRIEKLPAFMANMDVGHGGTYSRPHGGEFAKVALAWFKWQLKGDKEASQMFTGEPCELSKSPNWKVEKKNIP
jgi:hypothetical protein